jgi:alanine dehydrogenase
VPLVGAAHDAGVRDVRMLDQHRFELGRRDLEAVLPKPTLQDVSDLRDGQVLWGWPHAVQDSELTQLAIDKRLTLIAWKR